MIIRNKSQEKIVAIVVLYNPFIVDLLTNLNQIASQVDEIVLVDNSAHKTNIIELFDNKNIQLKYICNYSNLGIAKAQNIGIKYAIKNNADFILFLDQDSYPDNNIVNYLYNDYYELKNKNVKIGAIGCLAINKDNNLPYLPRLKKIKTFSFNHNIYIANEIISSGSLISVKILEKVGFFDELLFIDGVDHEWCWRSKMFGYICAISARAKLFHSLGDGDKKLLGFRIAISSSFRIYYQYRNFIYLSKKKYVPTYWKLNNAVKYFIKVFYLPIFVSKSYFKQICKGVKDGIFLKH